MHKFLRLVRRVCRKFKPNETSLQLCEVIQKLDFMPKIRSRVESHTLHFWDSATLWPARCRGPGNGRSECKPFPRIEKLEWIRHRHSRPHISEGRWEIFLYTRRPQVVRFCWGLMLRLCKFNNIFQLEAEFTSAESFTTRMGIKVDVAG